MCTRIIQYRPGADYAAALNCAGVTLPETLDPDSPGYNLAPGASVRIIRRSGDSLTMDRSRWGLAPRQPDSKESPVTRLRALTAASESEFATMWRDGRCILPADGWYEWQGEGVRAQPFRIRLPQDEALFIAAMMDPGADEDRQDGGLVMITAQLGFGLLDSDDQRPVVFAAEEACLWLDPATSAEAACKLATELLLPAPAFQWYPVAPAVHNPIFNNAQALEEVAIPA